VVPAEAPLMTVFRLTFARADDQQPGDTAWTVRVAHAAPMGLRLEAAYIDAANLVVYVDADADAEVLIARFADRLGLGSGSACRVQPLRVRDALGMTGPTARELVGLRRAEVVDATVASDSRTLSLKVRHKPYEVVDRVEAKESDDFVEVTVWVGSAHDDARRHYVTLEEAFSVATTVLDQPLGTRRVIDVR
jgi:hypothetical protein